MRGPFHVHGPTCLHRPQCTQSCITALLSIHSPRVYTQPPHVYTAPLCIPSPSPCIQVFLAPMHGFQGLAWTPVCTAVTGTHRHTAKQGRRYMGAHTCTPGTYPPRGPCDWETSPNLTAGHARLGLQPRTPKPPFSPYWGPPWVGSVLPGRLLPSLALLTPTVEGCL